MSGFRITLLQYRLRLPSQLSYRDIQRELRLDGFDARFDGEVCKFIPHDVFDNEPSARAQLEPQLDAWRAWTLLNEGQDWLPFVFESSTKASWPEDDGSGPRVSAVATALPWDVVHIPQVRDEYPPVPVGFAPNVFVHAGLTLLQDARSEPRHVTKIVSAYSSLLASVHAPMGGNRREALCRDLSVHKDVLNDLNRLCTHGGDLTEGRTFKIDSPPDNRIELTQERREWLIRTFIELIKREGQFAAGAPPSDQYAARCP